MLKMRFITVLFSFFFATLAFSQPWKESLKLSFSTEKINDESAYLVIDVSITKDWHIFSKNHDPNKSDFIGMPTTMVLSKSKDYIAIGKFTESPKAKVHNDEFGVSLIFLNKATFKQKIELKSSTAKGTVLFEGQVCHDEKGCIPFDKEFTFDLSGYLKEAKTPVTTTVKDKEIVTEDNTVTQIDTEAVESEVNTSAPEIDKELTTTATDYETSDTGKKSSGWIIFLLGFGSGMIALLTPCVFPMIPMTVSYFTKSASTRRKGIINALIYGFSIIIIYVSVGLILTLFLGKTGLNDLSTNIWMNLLFFAVFVIFAFSFLGAFEIQLPAKWVNKADSKADKGGLIGIFFMAFTLSLVSFSCTGPIVGTLIVEASQTGLYGPIIGMIGFSLALALPFTLFAIFPGWLNSMPQSGGWLNSVKVVLGLMELALALKFLSGVDLAYRWGIVTRELFIASWVVIFAVTGFYLLGKIRFANDSPTDKLSVTRFMFATVFLVFTVYLIPGMFGAPLKIIDGVAPPRSHSEDHFKFVSGYGSASGTAAVDDTLYRFTSQMHEVDGGIKVFHDLELGEEYAKIVNKPILLDFTGYNCANCRRTESTVWTNEKIRPKLLNDYVIVSLYVDDKTPLPESEQVFSEILNSKKRYVGHNSSELQIKKYNQVSQPLYVILDADGKDLTKPIGYTPDINEYHNFLQKGLDKFNRKR